MPIPGQLNASMNLESKGVLQGDNELSKIYQIYRLCQCCDLHLGKRDELEIFQILHCYKFFFPIEEKVSI